MRDINWNNMDFTYNNRAYIPNIEDLRRMLMDEIHQDSYSGHPGYQKTIATARK